MIPHQGRNFRGAVLSVRADDIDPHEPDAEVTVTAEDHGLPTSLFHQPVDMVFDGTAYVLPGLMVTFDVEPCCITCREVIVDARVRDADLRHFRGRVRLLLDRPECPDPDS